MARFARVEDGMKAEDMLLGAAVGGRAGTPERRSEERRFAVEGETEVVSEGISSAKRML